MNQKMIGSCNLTLRFAMLFMAAAVSFNLQANELKFEQVFSEKNEPASLHYQAVFTAKGTEHQMEVWRDGDNRVKRRTDNAIETYAFRKTGDSEFQMSILDMKKRIHTQIDRTNLLRIGNFTDWYDLTHGLKHPAGKYQLTKTHAPEGTPAAIETCQWYDLMQDSKTNHICWNMQNHLPLLIQTQGGQIVWRVTAMDRNSIPSKTFDIHDEGFIRNDANQDIERD